MLTFYISMLETEEQQDKFSYIYQNYVGFMYHVAKEVVKEHYLAEDVVHETFLQLIRIIDKVHIDDELTLRAFLRYIAEFTSDSGGWYTVRVVDIGSEQEVGIDNELTRYYELEFDGNHAIWGIREDNSNVLVWEADGLSFTIYGNPNISELIKVAEGITVDSTLK